MIHSRGQHKLSTARSLKGLRFMAEVVTQTAANTNAQSFKFGFLVRLYEWYTGGTYDQLLVKAAITIQLILLSLSLIHQTNAVSQVTGMSWSLAFMQAVVQDFGLFVSELVLIRFQQTGRSTLWATLFVVFAALASGSGNVFDFTQRLETYSVNWWLSACYGASVPLQVLLLGKMVSQLVTEKKQRPAAATAEASSKKRSAKPKDSEEPEGSDHRESKSKTEATRVRSAKAADSKPAREKRAE